MFHLTRDNDPDQLIDCQRVKPKRSILEQSTVITLFIFFGELSLLIYLKLRMMRNTMTWRGVRSARCTLEPGWLLMILSVYQNVMIALNRMARRAEPLVRTNIFERFTAEINVAVSFQWIIYSINRVQALRYICIWDQNKSM